MISAAAAAGKIPTAGAFSTDQAGYYRDLGVRVFFVGVDLVLKRQVLTTALADVRDALGQ